MIGVNDCQSFTVTGLCTCGLPCAVDRMEGLLSVLFWVGVVSEVGHAAAAAPPAHQWKVDKRRKAYG